MFCHWHLWYATNRCFTNAVVLDASASDPSCSFFPWPLRTYNCFCEFWVGKKSHINGIIANFIYFFRKRRRAALHCIRERKRSPLLQTLYERTVSWHIVLVLLKILQLAVLLHLYHTHNLSWFYFPGRTTMWTLSQLMLVALHYSSQLMFLKQERKRAL